MRIITEEPPGKVPRVRNAAIEETRETHVSWLYFTKNRVLKVKKPVSLGFLDFSDARFRRIACHDEVELNRRLSPRVYRGVLHGKWRGDAELEVLGACPSRRCGFTGHGHEHIVEMLRLPQERALSRIAERGALEEGVLSDLAETISAFHARAPAGIDEARYGTAEAVRSLVSENLAELAPFAGDRIGASLYLAAKDAQTRFLSESRQHLVRRHRAGKVRDGHGDLHLDHVFDLASPDITPPLSDTDRFAIIDCIEFGKRFRCADVAADVAFLHMSLMLHGLERLAEHWISAYSSVASDHDLYRVIDFYVLYRALVRLKVACISREELAIDRHQDLARRLLSRRHAPRLVAVGGPVGSGKSTLAEHLARRIGAVLVRSDVLRKRLLGIEPTASARAPPDKGAYDPALTQRIYEGMIDAAEAVMESGRSVVLDATWPTPDRRAVLAVAARKRGAPFRFVSLSCDRDTVRRRLAERDEKQNVISDARAADVEFLWNRYKQPLEIPSTNLVKIDTTKYDIECALARITASLKRTP